MPTPRVALQVALVVTALVTAVSHLAPEAYANTAVGAVFLGATWLLVLRRDTATVRAFGLSLGGVTEPEPLDARRMARDSAGAVAWALAFALIFFPPFWLGYAHWWQTGRFALALPPEFGSQILGQLLVIALPEEAFYRGYLQTALDAGWSKRSRTILGAKLGPGWLLSAAIFAVGHLLTIPHPSRLAVFFPALAFGWLRARTGGIGAGVVFHALCNLFTAVLAQSYGLRL
jgi:uncharacterized protein